MRMYIHAMKRFNFFIDPIILKKLRVKAKERKIKSVGTLLRMIIDNFLNEK